MAFNNPDVDVLKLTPSHLSLVKELGITTTNVGVVICGGEQLTRGQVNGLKQISKVSGYLMNTVQQRQP